MELNQVGVRQWFSESMIRGVGRIADKSRRPTVRVLWSTAFIACLAMLIYHSQYLFTGYLKFDYVTANKEVAIQSRNSNQVC